MQIDLDHLHHWMRAIRESEDPMRTMDAFWRGQLKSKEWLIDCLDEHVDFASSLDIHGGWVGVLASMLFQSNIPITTIRSIDIDPSCSDADIVVNTSFEHISQDQYNLWLARLPHNSIIVLQSNNYNIPEHIRIAQDLEEFKKQAELETVMYEGELELPLYKRFMLIGRK